MRIQSMHYQIGASLVLASTLPLSAILLNAVVNHPVMAQTSPAALNVVVNSAMDGPVTPDATLTLREAIELTNGTLLVESLSSTEKSLVAPSANGLSTIRFNLVGDTSIELVSELPPLDSPGLTVDGSSQPGYGPIGPATRMVTPVPIPVVTLKPASGLEVSRGLTVTADEVTIRGLSIYGFSTRHRSTETTPPADIFITHLVPPVDAGPGAPPARDLYFADESTAPVGVVIEDNWLGISPAGEMPDGSELSAFGVSVFNGVGTVIQRNRIEYHEGSAIITGARAKDMVVTENTLVGNGLAGMPDTIRLDGDIGGSEIFGNLMCGGDGSGIFMFKPAGSARIYQNDIRFNGRRLRRSAVYLMGSGHEVTDNLIGYQPGPGVSVAAYPDSRGNVIRNNQFTALDGLSVDLGYNDESRVFDFQRSDGPNPPRNSPNRRNDTGNAAVNAPQLDSYLFPLSGNQATVTGIADPGSEIDIYSIVDKQGSYGSLYELLETVTTDGDGRFSATVSAPAGTGVSAIATDPRYGTSEPSAVASLGNPDFPVRMPYVASCEIAREPEPEPIPLPMDEPLRLQIPQRIHFALDRSDISPESAAIMNDIITVLNQYPFIVVELEGHTDPRASNAYNQALGGRRAQAARDYLLRQGIAPERMRIRSYGETQRFSDGSGRIDYARDRRVEFIFLDTRGLDIIFENPESDLQIEP
jgi:outer membrane protein OmpA-like peptidoglycan-associated protein